MEIQPYPFNMTDNNRKHQLPQKQIQFVFNVSTLHIEQCQHRIKDYPDRVLYDKGGEKKDTFNLYKHQLAIRLHGQHDNRNKEFQTSISNCLNGLGKKKENKEDGQYDINHIWNDIYFVGVIKNNVNVSDPGKKNQLQTNVIVHGDAQIYNNGAHNWYPGQLLIIKVPSPNLNHNIRFKEFPEHTFYPIAEPLQHNQGMIPNAENFMKFIHDENLKNPVDNKFAPWIIDFYNHLIRGDVIKGKFFALANNKKTTIENDIEIKNVLKELYPLNDPDQKAHRMFALFEELHHQLHKKVVGKACSYTPTGHMGNIVITK